MKPTVMLEKHFTNKFGAIANLHKTMNVCLFDLKLVQVVVVLYIGGDECKHSKLNTWPQSESYTGYPPDPEETLHHLEAVLLTSVCHH